MHSLLRSSQFVSLIASNHGATILSGLRLQPLEHRKPSGAMHSSLSASFPSTYEVALGLQPFKIVGASKRCGILCQSSSGNRQRGFADVKSTEGKKGANETESPGAAPLASLPQDVAFEERLAAIRKTAPAKKKEEQEREVSPLDYDAPLSGYSDGGSSSDGGSGSINSNPWVKVGGGVAAAVLAALFIVGDIFPGMYTPPPQSSDPGPQLSIKDRATLNLQVERFEGLLKANPEDRSAQEGLAVSYVQLGELEKSATQLLALTQGDSPDAEALRLLAEVRAAQKEYGASVEAYRRAVAASPTESLELLQGLTETLILDGKAEEAVGDLLSARSRVAQASTVEPSAEGSPDGSGSAERQGGGKEDIDSVQLALLLGRAFAASGQADNAAAVYDDLIASRPDDFRGVLAKAVLERLEGKQADADRLFMQARLLAPEGAKAIVDGVTRQRGSR
eukprot:TRINITY_DN35944_c0_g1_i1.p1 TRINITY_DN35944_c0_g1~~TRINITY_DN35944_c0_g1_i1.p1  ORF type:complete len:451 (+),score=72.95 TRINITY_DN35944_c0_g1_i1:213-1565(+)